MRGADALLGGVSVVAAGAGIHRRHKHKRRGIVDAVLGATDAYVAVLQRLPHHFQNAAIELGKFVKKEHPIVSQANLPRRGISATTNQGTAQVYDYDVGQKRIC